MSKILVLNFTKSESAKIAKKLGKDVHQGFLQTDMELTQSSDGLARAIPEMLLFYSPDSIYEYDAIYILLHNGGYQDAKNEISISGSEWTERDSNSLVNYIRSGKGQVIFILGESVYESLGDLGLNIALPIASKSDKRIDYVGGNRHPTAFKKLLDDIRKDIVLPLSRYTVVNRKYYNSSDMYVRDFYVNANSDTVGVYFDFVDYEYEDYDKPWLLIMPLVKDVAAFVCKVSESLTPVASDKDWKISFKYFPAGIVDFKTRLESEKERHDTEKEQIRKDLVEYTQKFDNLTALLTETGDKLVDAVQWALGDVIELEVTNSDTLLKKGSKKEDLTLHNGGKYRLAEVKGAGSQNPSPKYFSQLATHYALNRNTIDIEGLLLIINYDIENAPESRPIAYTGELEPLMDDIAFLDTRVLHKIARDVIDDKLSKADAKKIVLGIGRITY